MPRTRSLAWSELKIGLLTITAIVIAAVLVFSLTGAKGLFWQRYTLKTRFPNVAGLAAGSPVRVAGVQVGSVKDIEFAGEQVDVDLRGEQEGARAHHRQVDRDPRLGVAARVERRGHHARRRPARRSRSTATCRRGTSKGQFADIAEQATSTIDEVTGLVHDLRHGQGNGGQADHRRAPLRGAEAVRRHGRPDDARNPAGPRHARQAAEGPEDGQRARGVAQEHRGHDAADQRRRGQPRQAAEGRRVRAVADRRRRRASRS